jgi:hypothetical protein
MAPRKWIEQSGGLGGRGFGLDGGDRLDRAGDLHGDRKSVHGLRDPEGMSQWGCRAPTAGGASLSRERRRSGFVVRPTRARPVSSFRESGRTGAHDPDRAVGHGGSGQSLLARPASSPLAAGSLRELRRREVSSRGM